MEITEVRIKLMEDSDDRLQGFCSITFDDSFVVRDLKIIEGTSGPFVAMPSRKLTGHCHSCGSKNHLKANYCNQCGSRQREVPMLRDAEGRAKLYADIPKLAKAEVKGKPRLADDGKGVIADLEVSADMKTYDEFAKKATALLDKLGGKL